LFNDAFVNEIVLDHLVELWEVGPDNASIAIVKIVEDVLQVGIVGVPVIKKTGPTERV